jgi:PAS domain-containing protein
VAFWTKLAAGLARFNFFAERNDRSFLALAVTGVLFLLPFAANNFLQGRPILGAVMTAVVAWFVVHGVAVYRGRRLLPAWAVFAPVLGTLGYVCALRIVVTLVLTIAFANVFSYLGERQEKLLALERDRLALLVHATRAGFTDWDAATDTVAYSERFKEMLGYPRDFDTSAWKSFFDLLHHADREPVREALRAALRRKRLPGLQQPGEALDYRLQRADGAPVWVHAESLAQVDAGGRILRLITSFQDVSRFRANAKQGQETEMKTGSDPRF